MKRCVVLSLFLLAGCSSNPPDLPGMAYPNVYPGNAAWELRAQTWAQYTVQTGTGKADLITGVVTPDASMLTNPTYVMRVTNLAAVILPGSNQLATARCQGSDGVVIATLPADTTSCWLERETDRTIGECGNGVILLDPPEPLITVSPIVGEILTTNTAVVNPDGTRSGVETRYQTIAVGITYHGFANATVTTLIERPQTQPRAYLQVFADGELAELIYGDVAPDGTVADLTYWRRVTMGRNP